MDCDAVIVGAGLVGTSFACALGSTGRKIALVEEKQPVIIQRHGDWDNRVYTLSPGSVRFLRQLDIWQKLDASRLAPIYEMRIWGDDGQSRMDFNAMQVGASELGWVVENSVLQEALWQHAQELENLTLFSPASCASLYRAADSVAVVLNDQRSLLTKLVVGADGRESWLRQSMGVASRDIAYAQMGVVANFEVERCHHNVAYQWFYQDSVLAWLPLPGNRISMVWSAGFEEANKLMAAAEDVLCDKVMLAGHGQLGRMKMMTRPAQFPLHLMLVDAMVGSRFALLGDAAHSIHPLAGQGVNLGFQDARALAAVLSESRETDWGSLSLLRRYERERSEGVLAMQLMTDGLCKLFSSPSLLLCSLRNRGLSLADRMVWLKRMLAHYAMA